MTTIKASEITSPIGKTGGVVYIAREIEQTIDKLLKQGKVVLVTEILPSRGFETLKEFEFRNRKERMMA